MTPDELRTRMAALPEPPADSKPPLWDYWRHDLWQHVARGDDPNGFMGWPCVYHTMLQNHWIDVIHREFQDLYIENQGNWPIWNNAMMAPSRFYPPDNYPQSTHHPAHFSANLIHQAYHLYKWQQATGRKIADLDSIVEFGGGYGAMALVASRLGFKGQYAIVDLPEFGLLQYFFLTNAAPSSTLRVHCRDMAAHEPGRFDLLVAGYSLSECDYGLRDKFLVENPADSYLLWYSNRFEEYNNVEYFQHRLPSMLPDMNWKHWQAAHMPPETWYSVGWRT